MNRPWSDSLLPLSRGGTHPAADAAPLPRGDRKNSPPRRSDAYCFVGPRRGGAPGVRASSPQAARMAALPGGKMQERSPRAGPSPHPLLGGVARRAGVGSFLRHLRPGEPQSFEENAHAYQPPIPNPQPPIPHPSPPAGCRRDLCRMLRGAALVPPNPAVHSHGAVQYRRRTTAQSGRHQSRIGVRTAWSGSDRATGCGLWRDPRSLSALGDGRSARAAGRIANHRYRGWRHLGHEETPSMEATDTSSILAFAVDAETEQVLKGALAGRGAQVRRGDITAGH